MLIAQITDTHIKLPGRLAYKKVDTAAMLRRCVQELLALSPQPDIVLLTGDLVDLGRPEEYEHLKSILAPIRQRIIAIPGNHDEREAMRAAFRDASSPSFSCAYSSLISSVDSAKAMVVMPMITVGSIQAPKKISDTK